MTIVTLAIAATACLLLWMLAAIGGCITMKEVGLHRLSPRMAGYQFPGADNIRGRRRFRECEGLRPQYPP